MKYFVYLIKNDSDGKNLFVQKLKVNTLDEAEQLLNSYKDLLLTLNGSIDKTETNKILADKVIASGCWHALYATEDKEFLKFNNLIDLTK